MPGGRRIYAIGDIHGRADLLARLLARVSQDMVEAAGLRHTIVFLGDYVDRGNNPAAVLDQLSRIGTRFDTVFLKGNHETMLLDFLRDANTLQSWAMAGGLPTLVSYGLTPPLRPSAEDAHELREAFLEVLPPAHMSFLQSLRPCYAAEDYFFVHAGVRPFTPLADQVEEDLLWIRHEFLDHQGLFEKRIVHGHTPVKVPDVLPNRINIDTGAFATGNLTCIVLEADEMRFL